MKIIAHRGLLNGPESSLENSIESISRCLDLGFDVEVDIRLINNKLYLGHDDPIELLNLGDIDSSKVWFHAKDIQVAHFLLSRKIEHVFYHEDDPVVLTSSGYIWSNLNSELTESSICVLPEQSGQKFEDLNCFGVCTDFPILYKKRLRCK